MARWTEADGTTRLYTMPLLEGVFQRVPVVGETIILSRPARFLGTVQDVMWYLDGRADVILEPFSAATEGGPSSAHELAEWGFVDQTEDYEAQGG